MADLLAEDCATMPDAKLQAHLRAIVQYGRKVSRITDELLLAQVRRGEVELSPLNMAVIVTEAWQRLADLAEEYRAEISLPEAWPAALGHGPWVEEVWVNYLSNAIKYGGRPPRLELGAVTRPDGQVRFWVRDNGLGLALEKQARLFAPFTQLDQVRATGYGLGLSIVRCIVEKLGGQVGVESDGVPGHGSVFSFTLPGVPTPGL
jgi:signal transduction histidine kinase